MRVFYRKRMLAWHGEKNYPFRRVPSPLDIDLPRILDRDPDIVFYQCGVDRLVYDSLGRLSLMLEGLLMRNRMVLESCHGRSIPVMMALGGGYAHPNEPTVQALCNMYRIAREVFSDV